MSGDAALAEVPVDTPWGARFAQRTQRITSSAIRGLLKFTEQPDVIFFAGGLPAPWTRPPGGLFLWVTLPAGLDPSCSRMLWPRRWPSCPGRPSFRWAEEPGPSGSISPSACGERIEEGIARLGAVLQKRLAGQ